MREEGGGRISESDEKAKSWFSQLADVSFGPAVVEEVGVYMCQGSRCDREGSEGSEPVSDRIPSCGICCLCRPHVSRWDWTEIEMSEAGWMMRIRTSWSECLFGREAAAAHLAPEP